MGEAVFYILSSFWAGAVHAATPSHGKTIAAAYIIGARGGIGVGMRRTFRDETITVGDHVRAERLSCLGPARGGTVP